MRRTPLSEANEWKQVAEAYYWDKLQAAYEMALDLGVGSTAAMGRFYRGIEGEYITRQRSRQEEIAPWLTLETIPEEVGDAGELAPKILAACEEVAKWLGLQERPPILVSVLASEADAPWSIGRFGYFVDKYPYDKICLPNRAAIDPEYLASVVMHEYAHAVVLNVAQGHAPRWLDEMIAMLAQGGPEKDFALKLASGQARWLDPSALNVQYTAEQEGQSGAGVYLAYQQSACIGAYLVDLKGEDSLRVLLRSFSDNSLIKELAMRLFGTAPADEALKQTYGMRQKQLFRNARRWLQSGFRV